MLTAKRNKHTMKKSRKSTMDYILSFGLVIVMIIISFPRTALAQAFSKFDGSNSTMTTKVKLPNTEYTESTIDLTVQALGGQIKLKRSWTNNRWYINPAWADLSFTADSLDKSIKSIDRTGMIYSRTGNSDLYSFGEVYIKKMDSGWQWYDRQGNWINYDSKGRVTEYGDRNNKVTFEISAEGRRTAIKDHHGELVYRFKYDADERLIEVKDREDRTVTYHWQGNLLVKVTDVLGNSWLYEYDTNGQLTQKTDPEGSTKKIAYAFSTAAATTGMISGKDAGQITYLPIQAVGSSKSKKESKYAAVGATYSSGSGGGSSVAMRTFDTKFNKQQRTYSVVLGSASGSGSGAGSSVASMYSLKGKKLSESKNGVTTHEQKQDNNITRYKDERGLITTVEFDNAKRATKITRPDGLSVSYTYENNFNQVTEYINPQGTITKLQYDSRGNMIKAIQAVDMPEQQVSTWSYNSYGQPTTLKLGEGDNTITLHQSFDKYGNVESFTDGNGYTYQSTYNIQGQITSVTNPLNSTWKTTYNLAGYPTQSIDPLNNTTTYTSDTLGRITSARDPLGKVTNYRYNFDDNGWKIEQINALNQTITYYYDLEGHPIKAVSPSGLEITQSFDTEGRVIQKTDAAGNILSLKYGAKDSNLSGLLIKALYPTYSETYQYNTAGAPTQVTQILDASTNLMTKISYNELDKPVSVIKANNSSSTIKHDALGRITKLIDALGGENTQIWDTFGNVIQLIDAKGNTYTFTYDNNGNIITETKALGNIVEYSYDVANQLIQEKDTAGNIANYQYDTAGRTIQKTYTSKEQTTPSQTITYGYDNTGRIISITQVGDTNTQFVYICDELGRTIKETITYGTGSQKITNTLKYSYDIDGNLATLTYPDNTVVSYTYEKGLLKQTQLANGEKITWEQYLWQKPTKVSYPGATQTFSYDGLQRPLNIKVVTKDSSTVMNRNYTHDKVGNIIERNSENGNTQYSYDLLDRLTLVDPAQTLQQLGLTTESYSYDAINNRIGSAQQLGDWLYNSNDQLIQYGQDTEQAVLTYTANGYLSSETIADKTTNYYYNAADRLVAVKENDKEIAFYQYDSQDRRISKTVNGATTYYLYTDEGLIAELNEQGSMLVAYGWESDTEWGTSPLWQANIPTNSTLVNAEYNYLYTDHLGTPQLAINATGQITWQAVSEAFGKTLLYKNNQTIVNLRFPGQYYDQETGLHYNYFRSYNPRLGRYTQVDPIGLEGGWNLFSYVKGNPLTFTDVYGLNGWYYGFDYDRPLPCAFDFDIFANFIRSYRVGGEGYAELLALGTYEGIKNWGAMQKRPDELGKLGPKDQLSGATNQRSREAARLRRQGKITPREAAKMRRSMSGLAGKAASTATTALFITEGFYDILIIMIASQKATGECGCK